MKYRALITDLDGTAVPIGSDGRHIDTETQTAVRRAQDTGHQVACATGRQWELTQPIITKLGLTSPCVIEGGTRIVDPVTGATLWEKAMERGISMEVLSIFKSHSSVGTIMHSTDTNNYPVDTVSSVPDRLRFLYMLAIAESSAIAITNTINDRSLSVVAHYTPSWYGEGRVDIHVTDREATKEHAIKVWQKMLGITHDETIGMGDSGNDLPIFESAGLKVAVANATPALKELADYTAPDVNDDALKHVIERFLLRSDH